MVGRDDHDHPVIEQGLAGWVLRSRQPLLINENMAQKMEKYGSRVLPGTHFGKSMIMVPMVAGDQARGSVDISDFEREHGLAGPRLALDQQRPLERDRTIDRVDQRTRGDVAGGPAFVRSNQGGHSNSTPDGNTDAIAHPGPDLHA